MADDYTGDSGQSRACIIAEIGTSHNGSLKRAAELIKAAADSGADCVKTQIVFANEIIHPNTGFVELPGGNIRLYDRFLELEQDFDFYLELKKITTAAGLDFMASPFGLKSLDWLLRLDCDSIKIASPELNHFPLLEAAASSGKKMILSTGVSKLEDIKAALTSIKNNQPADAPSPSLLHCITAYPAPAEEYNLRIMQSLSEQFKIEVGVSDHSRDAELVPAAAAALGAVYVEKHITIENSDGGLDDPIALTPQQFKLMITAVREIETEAAYQRMDALRARYGAPKTEMVLGDGIKRLAPSEAANYGRTNRSVHALTSLAAKTVLTAENTALLRTEKKLRPGMRPEFYNGILGKQLLRPVESGQGITAEDIFRPE